MRFPTSSIADGAGHDSATTSSAVVIAEEVKLALIAWSVKLGSGQATPADYEHFKLWCASDPAHAQAWHRLQQLEAGVLSMPAPARHIAVETLDAAARVQSTSQSRRRTVKLLALGALGISTSAYILNHSGPWHMVADYDSKIGKKLRLQLADGTKVLMNTNSRISVRYTMLKREIVLNEGEIYLETGKDEGSPIGRRPFWVNTPHADLEAIGTRFAVEQIAAHTRLHVSEGIVAIHSEAKVVHAFANDTFAMYAAAQAPIKSADASFDPLAWVDGVLVAREMRLDAFVAELARYEPVTIRCDAGIAGLTVSGVFQLNRADPVDHALKALTRTLPVRVQQSGPGNLILSKK